MKLGWRLEVFPMCILQYSCYLFQLKSFSIWCVLFISLSINFRSRFVCFSLYLNKLTEHIKIVCKKKKITIFNHQTFVRSICMHLNCFLLMIDVFVNLDWSKKEKKKVFLKLLDVEFQQFSNLLKISQLIWCTFYRWLGIGHCFVFAQCIYIIRIFNIHDIIKENWLSALFGLFVRFARSAWV